MAVNSRSMESADREKLRQLMEKLADMRKSAVTSKQGDASAKKDRLATVYEYLPTDAECVVALEELAGEKKAFEAKAELNEKEKSIEELKAEIAELASEIESTQVDIDKSAGDPKKAKRVATMMEEIEEWKYQQITLEQELKARERGGVSEVEQLDLLIKDIEALRRRFQKASGRINKAEHRVKKYKQLQKEAILNTGDADLSMEEDSREQDLEAESRRQENVENLSRKVRRSVLSLKLIDKADAPGASLRHKTGHFLGAEHKDAVSEKKEALNLRPSELEIKLTLLHGGMEDTVPNRMKLEKYFGSAEYFRRRELYKQFREQTISDMARAEVRSSDGMRYVKKYPRFIEDYSEMLEYYLTNQLAMSQKFPEGTSLNVSMRWDRIIDQREQSNIRQYPLSDNISEAMQNTGVLERMVQLQTTLLHDQPSSRINFHRMALTITASATTAQLEEMPATEKQYRNEFNQLLPYLQKLILQGPASHYVLSAIVDNMNRQVPGYVRYVEGEGIRIDEKKYPDLASRLTNSVIDQIGIDIRRVKTEQEARERAEQQAREDVERKKREELQLKDRQKLERQKLEAQLIKLSTELLACEKQSMEDISKVCRLIMDRTITESSQSSISRYYESAGSMMTEDYGKGEKGKLISEAWLALEDKHQTTVPIFPVEITSMQDLLNRTDFYCQEISALCEHLETQIQAEEQKSFLTKRTKKLLEWKALLSKSKSIFQELAGENNFQSVLRELGNKNFRRANNETDLVNTNLALQNAYKEFNKDIEAEKLKFEEYCSFFANVYWKGETPPTHDQTYCPRDTHSNWTQNVFEKTIYDLFGQNMTSELAPLKALDPTVENKMTVLDFQSKFQAYMERSGLLEDQAE